MQEEKRGYARLSVGAEVAMSIMSADGAMLPQQVLLRDISLTGLRVVCGQQWTAQTIVQITIAVPGLTAPLSVTARVVWQARMSASFFETGLEFMQITDQARQELSAVIGSLLGRVEERRKFIRCNISTLITYRLAASPQVTGTCLSDDISKTGMKALCRQVLAPATCLHISFSLPDEGAVIEADAQVVWGKTRQDGLQEIGLEFIGVRAEDVEKIGAYIKQTLGLDWI